MPRLGSYTCLLPRFRQINLSGKRKEQGPHIQLRNLHIPKASLYFFYHMNYTQRSYLSLLKNSKDAVFDSTLGGHFSQVLVHNSTRKFRLIEHSFKNPFHYLTHGTVSPTFSVSGVKWRTKVTSSTSDRRQTDSCQDGVLFGKPAQLFVLVSPTVNGHTTNSTCFPRASTRTQRIVERPNCCTSSYAAFIASRANFFFS